MARFAKLTDPDGRYVWIAKDTVTKVQIPSRDQYSENVLAIIVMDTILQPVVETPEVVITLLEEA